MPRPLVVSSAVSIAALIPASYLVLVFDAQPLALMPSVLGACALAVVAGVAFLPFLAARTATKCVAMLPITAALALIPYAIPREAFAARFLVGLVCGLMMLKVFDLYLGSERGIFPNATTSLLFLASPFLVFRRIPWTPPRDVRAEAGRFVRSVFEALAGAIVLTLAFRMDWRTLPFLLEHGVKVTALCVTLFRSLDALTSLMRMLGGVAQDFTDHPFSARTPAEFWRRYNLWVGLFFYEDVFKVAGGRRSPARATLLVFLFSGLLHEYLFFVIVGRAYGYQLVFFALQGLAVAATLRVRPKGWMAGVGMVMTLVFNLLTSVVFFRNAARFEPWIYASPRNAGAITGLSIALDSH